MPHALLLKYPGTNCDAETERALRAAGFSAAETAALLGNNWLRFFEENFAPQAPAGR